MKKTLMVCLLLAMATALFAGQVTHKQVGTRSIPIAKYKNITVPVAPHVGPVRPTHTASLDDITENFDSYPGDWELPEGWTQVDVDGGYCTQFTRNSTWGIENFLYAHSGANAIACHYNDAGLANNDWLILPQFTPAAGCSITYWEGAQDPDYVAESWQIKVSTTGTLPANFTNLVYSHTNTDTNWTRYAHSLATYVGQPIYLAIHYTSVDQFIARFDDISVAPTGATATGSVSGTVTDAESHDPLAGAVVTVIGGGTDTTDAAGAYAIASVSAGTHVMRFALTGYITGVDSNVVVVENEDTVVDMELTAQAIGGDITENFDSYPGDWELPEGWTQVDVDGGYCTQFTRNSTWGIENFLYAHSGANAIANHYNDAGLANNDWLILPQFVPAAGCSISYWEGAQDPDYVAESWQIKVSTTGMLPANFSNLVYSHTNTDTNWTRYAHSLATYVGQPIYLAVHYTSVDQFIARFDDFHVGPTGTPDAVGDQPHTVPSTFAFHGNYPNPFNGMTDFRFDIPATGNVSLKLYNLVGQEVGSVLNGVMTAGSHTVSFNANTLPSGVYFARLSAAGVSATRKMMLLK